MRVKGIKKPTLAIDGRGHDRQPPRNNPIAVENTSILLYFYLVISIKRSILRYRRGDEVSPYKTGT
jgi:hypothetical protein